MAQSKQHPPSSLFLIKIKERGSERKRERERKKIIVKLKKLMNYERHSNQVVKPNPGFLSIITNRESQPHDTYFCGRDGETETNVPGIYQPPASYSYLLIEKTRSQVKGLTE